MRIGEFISGLVGIYILVFLCGILTLVCIFGGIPLATSVSSISACRKVNVKFSNDTVTFINNNNQIAEVYLEVDLYGRNPRFRPIHPDPVVVRGKGETTVEIFRAFHINNPTIKAEEISNLTVTHVKLFEEFGSESKVKTCRDLAKRENFTR